ncbi:MAG: TIGR04141 family sporadically distributed protein [Saprospiraceae bacterium]|nr:TIGR04141 family sporadically distributed protein [Saprospiraceae bacterium]
MNSKTENEDFIRQNRQQVKLYRINTSQYELRGIGDLSKKIIYIINTHRQATEDIVDVDLNLNPIVLGNINYFLYTFSLKEKNSIWNYFLPETLTEDIELITRKPSLVVFAFDEKNIFCLVGGSGMQVIKRYLDSDFGLDLYSMIAKVEEDLVLSAKYRGMTGNLAGSTEVYRNEHKLIDTMSFGRIYKEILFEISEAQHKEYFDFISEDKNTALSGFAGSAFQIRSAITFEQTHLLIEKVIEIINTKKPKGLGSFSEIKDNGKIENIYRRSLYEAVRNDMKVRYSDGGYKEGDKEFDFDFGHPTQLLDFYECDIYFVTTKILPEPIVETTNREDVYKKTLQFISETQNLPLLVDFMRFVGGLIVTGIKENKKPIKSPFLDCISCELSDEFNKPIFCIDKKWYKVDENFIEGINNDCSLLMQNARIRKDILPEIWENPKNTDEGDYNLQYLGKPNYLVLDKMLGQNIELCDILFIDESEIYLIHIKKGFDGKIRDLTNQIIISSQRLWNDLKSEKKFIREVYGRYRTSTNHVSSPITEPEFINLFNKKIHFVLAFTSTLQNNKSIFENLRKVKSNIAKFSFIQCVRDMKSESYPLSACEIMSK